jgi:hypothetical protein
MTADELTDKALECKGAPVYDGKLLYGHIGQVDCGYIQVKFDEYNSMADADYYWMYPIEEITI